MVKESGKNCQGVAESKIRKMTRVGSWKALPWNKEPWCHSVGKEPLKNFKQDSISFREKQTSVQKYNCGNRSINALEMGKELK